MTNLLRFLALALLPLLPVGCGKAADSKGAADVPEGGGTGVVDGSVDVLDGSTAPRHDGGATDAGSTTPGSPHLGAHTLAFRRINTFPVPSARLDTQAMATQATGSTIVVSVGRGQIGAFELPTDNKGNKPYVQLGKTNSYTRWPSSGTALYAFPSAKGGADHILHAGTPPEDEITLAAVEIIDGKRIQTHEWTQVAAGNPLKSRTVTTSGPATLVSFWWGDADVDGDKTAVPNNGFVVVDSLLSAGALVQCAVAVKNVPAAGSYDVTWTATPVQGAQIWLVAIE